METSPTEIVEIIEATDYTPALQIIEMHCAQIAEASNLIAGFLLFFVVVILCYFAYKFMRIFF